LPTGKQPETSAFTTAGGEMAALIAATDWGGTVLGPADAWSQSLKTILRILVTSRYAMWMGWGPELTFFYNDAYAPTLGVKHSRALGQSANQVWAEIWKDIGPRAQSVMQTGVATWDEGLLLFLERSGYPEETYHTFSYSPLPDDDGTVAGMLCVVTEETQRVIGERRLDTLRDLGSALGAVRSEPEVMLAVDRSLARNDKDLPFTLIYLADSETGALRQVAATGGVAGVVAPEAPIRPGDLPFPVASVLAGSDKHVVHYITALPGMATGAVATGAWDKAPRAVAIVPIAQQGQAKPAGVFITGLNPYRPYDDAYAGFIELIAAQIASSLGAAQAYEAERRRAEALAEIDQAKTAFFSNVSHEFRTPLTLMLGPLEEEIADLARRQPGAADRLMMVHRNGIRLLRLVNTLLDFSRIEAGRVRARYRPIELSVFTEELASNFRSACERAGLRLDSECVALDRPVYVDTEMWERVVLNLVSNAFKYTLAGGITVGMQAAPDGQMVVLTVRDTGVGIPEAELTHIFDRFHRIEGQRGRTLEGTGIGLALVNELVRLHGGSIEVQSRVDVGTTIAVRIPFGSAHLPSDRVTEITSQSIPEGAAAAAFVEEALRWLPEDGGAFAEAPLETSNLLASLGMEAVVSGQERRRILLADDNADMRDYVVRLLRPGYEVEAVGDGQAALLAARANPPDLILSDVMMPHMDGFGLLDGIRTDPALRDLPVVLLSARAGEEARVEGLDGGADDYLVKPFSARELLARVRSNLDLARLRQEARDALRQVNETLEHRVAEEMAQRARAEESLRQAQKMEAIGHLTGGVAHDFNNLLTVIGGGVETLQRILATAQLGGDDARVKRALGMIAQGADRAATLTHRLLAFARRQTLDPRPLDPNKLVAGMSELLRRTLGESVALETVLAGGLWRTAADANQLENALLNLAVNARDAMAEGGKLTIETANTYLDEAYAASHDDVAPGQYVMIAVSDTGSGIDQLTLGRVFEPFFTTKDIGQGTGLGLSQVYGFIKQSNGHVKLYSEVGHGTVVKLYLPRLVTERAEVRAKAEDTQVPTGHGETVLVVEDEPAVREHSVTSLRELGYRVLAAGDGHAALRILARERDIEILFTDVGLPGGMTGRQLAEAARVLRPNLKVLYTTGYARNAIVHGGVLDPGTELLPKPFSYGALAAKVRTVLDG
jgi:signal transduction histidine kinase